MWPSGLPPWRRWRRSRFRGVRGTPLLASTVLFIAAAFGCVDSGSGPDPSRSATIDLALTAPIVNQLDSTLVAGILRATNTTADSVVVAFRGQRRKATGTGADTLAYRAYLVGDSSGTVTVTGYATGAPSAIASAAFTVELAALSDATVSGAEGDTLRLALRPLASGGDQPAFLGSTPSRPAFAVWRRNDSLFVHDPTRDSNGTVTVRISARFRQGTTASATVTLYLAPMTDFALRFIDMDGDPIRTPSQVTIDGIAYLSDTGGVWRDQVLPAVHTIGIPTSGVGEPAVSYELPAGLYRDSVRVVFPRLPTDTLTFGQDFAGSVRRAGTGANFDRTHYLATYDDPLAGQQGPRSGVLRLHVLRQANAAMPSCQTMTPTVLDTLRRFQAVQAGELAGYYTVIASEADTLPSSLTEQWVVLCQGAAAGTGIVRASGNLYGWAYATIPAGAGLATANAAGLVPVYGSSGTRDASCTVPSLFNDCPGSPSNSASRTLFDVREGLDMMKHFAVPAARRAAGELAAARPGRFFSLRP